MPSKLQEALDRELQRYVTDNPKSRAMQERAERSLPGGDSRNSIWWAPFPTYVVKGEGSKLHDIDGHARIDMINNMTTLILGHSHPAVVKAVAAQAAQGLSFPAPSELVVRWAEILVDRVPSLDKVRFVNSGTEGTLNAIRAARAFTGKDKIAKFEGGYHGAHDDVAVSVDPPMAKAGDPKAPNSVADYLGVPKKSPELTIVMPYNDLEASSALIEKHAHELAAVIVEPVIGRLGMVPADTEFLAGLRDLTRRLGIVLIFDEVIALRVARGGAQERFGVIPDMTAMGKIIGGGLPVGGFGGRADIMELFSPKTGPKVKHAGTFNGNPMTAAAGVATMEALNPEVYRRLDEMGERVRKKLSSLIKDREAPMGVTGVASLFALQFTTTPIRDYRAVQTTDRTLQRLMFIGLLNEGYAVSPACAGNVSSVLTEKEADGFVAAVGRVLDRAGYA